MKYIGKLYGKIGDTYFDTGKTTEDLDKLEEPLIEQNALIENERRKLEESKTCETCNALHSRCSQHE